MWETVMLTELLLGVTVNLKPMPTAQVPVGLIYILVY
jgi:hypothetical protein